MFFVILFAFLAGVVTILSPCILPVLPLVLSSSLPGEKIDRSRPVGVIVGFILSFTFFTLFLSSIIRLANIPSGILRLISIIVVAGFGLSLLVPKFQEVTEKFFAKIGNIAPNSRGNSGFIGGLIVGLSIGLLWTPCVGPILASVISLAVSGTVTLDSFLITLAYTTGTGIPMFLIMIGGQGLIRRVPLLFSNLGRIQKIFGVLMILTSIGIFFNLDRNFQTFILNTFPKYGTGLTKIEENKLVLDNLIKKQDKNVTDPNGKPMFSLLEQTGSIAPEIIPGGEWFNSKPLTLSGLRGKVVLLDFWTYSCINCQRTLPYLRDWYQKYKDKGLVIIGVHSPEFEFEKDPANVFLAIHDFGLLYPVVQDNNFATWRAYENNYWPAKYFIDKDGFIRYYHFGEGEYDKSEQVIQELLKEAGATNLSGQMANPDYQIYAKTPELYLGYERVEYLSSPEVIKKESTAKYTSPARLGQNTFSYEGDWFISKQYANPQKGSILSLNFESKYVYLVMRSKNGQAKIKVFVDGEKQFFGEDNVNGSVIVDADRLYKLISLPSVGRHILRLEFEDNSAELFAFTFG